MFFFLFLFLYSLQRANWPSDVQRFFLWCGKTNRWSSAHWEVNLTTPAVQVGNCPLTLETSQTGQQRRHSPYIKVKLVAIPPTCASEDGGGWCCWRLRCCCLRSLISGWSRDVPDLGPQTRGRAEESARAGRRNNKFLPRQDLAEAHRRRQSFHLRRMFFLVRVATYVRTGYV